MRGAPCPRDCALPTLRGRQGAARRAEPPRGQAQVGRPRGRRAGRGRRSRRRGAAHPRRGPRRRRRCASVGTVTTAQLSATSGQKRDRPFQRPATAMRMPMANMPSIESGQNRSSTSQYRPGRGRRACSASDGGRRDRQRQDDRSRARRKKRARLAARRGPGCATGRAAGASTPTWKSPEPSAEDARAGRSCSPGSLPNAAMATDQARAPAVSSGAVEAERPSVPVPGRGGGRGAGGGGGGGAGGDVGTGGGGGLRERTWCSPWWLVRHPVGAVAENSAAPRDPGSRDRRPASASLNVVPADGTANPVTTGHRRGHTGTGDRCRHALASPGLAARLLRRPARARAAPCSRRRCSWRCLGALRGQLPGARRARDRRGAGVSTCPSRGVVERRRSVRRVGLCGAVILAFQPAARGGLVLVADRPCCGVRRPLRVVCRGRAARAADRFR